MDGGRRHRWPLPGSHLLGSPQLGRPGGRLRRLQDGPVPRPPGRRPQGHRRQDPQPPLDRLPLTRPRTSRAPHGGLADPCTAETVGVSTDDQVIDVRTAAESSDLLDELPDLRVDDSDDDEPVLLRADGRPVDTWRERYPYAERMGRGSWRWRSRASASAPNGTSSAMLRTCPRRGR